MLCDLWARASPTCEWCPPHHDLWRFAIHLCQVVRQLVRKRDAFLHLENAISAHMDVEEKERFPEVMLANLDLSEFGTEMQACEAGIVAAEAPTLRKPERRI